MLWLVLSCVPAVIIVLTQVLEAGGRTNWMSVVPFVLLFEVPFMLVGLGMMVAGVMPYIARARLAPPEIGISSQTLRPGETFGVTYQQTFRGAANVQRATLHLVFRERATYRRGTNTYTVTHDETLGEYELPPRRYEAGEVLSGRYTFEIPASAMHSFEAMRNRLQWLLRAHVVVGGWPDFKEDYLLTVLPERRM